MGVSFLSVNNYIKKPVMTGQYNKPEQLRIVRVYLYYYYLICNRSSWPNVSKTAFRMRMNWEKLTNWKSFSIITLVCISVFVEA